MIELFLTLIIISAFICLMTVIIGIRSKSKVFPIISVCCAVMIIMLSMFSVIETQSQNEKPGQTKAYISVDAEQTKSSEKESTSAHSGKEDKHDLQRTVYITRTGEKYHYSYNCSDSDFYECTLEEALERGLEPCSRCVE